MPRLSDLRVGLGLDWGNSSPGCVVFGAALPDGHVHIWDEFKFQRMAAKDVAEAVKEKCRSWGLERVPSCACDPSLLPATKGERGEWIGQTLQRHGLPVFRVSNDRVSGWQRVHEALAMDPGTGTPWLTVHPRCKYLVRTVPLMVQAKHNPEDLDSDSDDHACLAGGTLVALERGDVPIEDVRLSDRAWTPDGLRSVLAVAMTDADAELWEVRSSDGRTLTATGNHPIMAMGQQISVDALRYGDILTTWPISHGVTGMLERNGGGWWGRFLEATRFITGMATRAITRSRTSSAFHLSSMPSVTLGSPTSSILSVSVPSRWIGTGATKGVDGIGSTGSAVGSLEMRWIDTAPSADAPIWTSPGVPLPNFAQTTASHSTGATLGPIWWFGCAPSANSSSASTSTTTSGAPVLESAVVCSSPRRSGRGKVYNLTVDGGVFFANGILTHNCDALRYLLMSGLRPQTGARAPERAPVNSMAWFRKYYGGAQPQGVLA